MGKWIGRLGLGIVILTVTLFAAVLLLPGFIDWSRYSDEISKEVSSRTGRNLVLGGDLQFKLFPQPALEVRQVAIEDTAMGGNLVEADRVAVNLELAPLFSGEVKVRSVLLSNASVNLKRDRQGNPNWVVERVEQETEPGVALDTRGDEPAIREFSIDSLQLENVSVSYDDQATGFSKTLTVSSAEIGAASLAGPFRMKGDVFIGEEKVSLQAGIGMFNALSETASITLEANVNNAIRVTYDGNFRNFESGPRFNGRTHIVSENALAGAQELAKLATELSGDKIELGSGLPALAQPLELDFSIATNITEVRIRDLEGKLGDQILAGDITGAWQGQISLDVVLTATGWRLDPWLMGEESSVTEQTSSETAVLDIKPIPGPSLPKNVIMTLDMTAETLLYGEKIIPGLKAVAHLNNGALTIGKMDLSLPSGAMLVSEGVIKTEGEMLHTDLTLSFDAPNLRGLANNFDVALGTIPSDRFMSAAFEGTVSIDEEGIKLSGEKVAIDDISGKIEVTKRFSGAPVDVAIEANRVNVSPYLSLFKDETPDPTPLTNPRKKEVAIAPAVPDADLTLSFNTLTYEGMTFMGVEAEAQSRNNRLTLDQMSIAEFAGSQLKMNGAVDLSTSPMMVDLTANIVTQDLTRLSAGVGQEGLGFLGNLSPFSGDVAVRSVGKGAVITVNANAAGSQIKLKGESPSLLIDPLTASGGVDLTVSSPSLSALAGLGMGANDLPKTGPVNLTASGDGSVSGIDLALKLAGQGYDLETKGRAKNLLIEPYADLSLSLKANDAQQFVSAVGGDGTSINRGQALHLRGDMIVSSDKISSDELRLTLGSNKVDLAIDTKMGGLRPRSAVQVVFGELDVDSIQAAKKTSKTVKTSNSSERPERWSKEALPLDVLRDWDIALDVNGKRLITSDLVVLDPSFKLDMEEGKGPFEFVGKDIFKGEVNGAGTIAVSQERTPKLDLTIAVDLAGADLALATEDLADPGKPAPLTGALEISSTLDLAGRTEAQLISSLSGSVRFSARNGVIRGVDLKQMSDQLDYLDDVAAFVSLARNTMNDGETAYRMIETVQLAEDGIFNTAQFAADVDAAEIILFNRVDLPSWRLDLDSRMKLREHPKAPDVGVRLAGALDDPKRTVDTEALQQFLISRFFERGIGRVLGIKEKRSAPVQEPDIQQSVNPFEEGPAPTQPKAKPVISGSGPTGAGPTGTGPTGSGPGVAAPQQMSPEDALLDTLLNQVLKKPQ